MPPLHAETEHREHIEPNRIISNRTESDRTESSQIEIRPPSKSLIKVKILIQTQAVRVLGLDDCICETSCRPSQVHLDIPQDYRRFPRSPRHFRRLPPDSKTARDHHKIMSKWSKISPRPVPRAACAVQDCPQSFLKPSRMPSGAKAKEALDHL